MHRDFKDRGRYRCRAQRTQPNFGRPRNIASSGGGARKTRGGQNESDEDSRNRNGSIQFQGSFVFDVVDANGAELMPKVENHGDDDGDAEADGEEDAIGGEQDEKSNDGGDGDSEGGATLE